MGSNSTQNLHKIRVWVLGWVMGYGIILTVNTTFYWLLQHKPGSYVWLEPAGRRRSRSVYSGTAVYTSTKGFSRFSWLTVWFLIHAYRGPIIRKFTVEPTLAILNWKQKKLTKNQKAHKIKAKYFCEKERYNKQDDLYFHTIHYWLEIGLIHLKV